MGLKRCDQCRDFLIPGETYWLYVEKGETYCKDCRDFANRYTANMFGNRLRMVRATKEAGR